MQRLGRDSGYRHAFLVAETAPVAVVPYDHCLTHPPGSSGRVFSACFGQPGQACAECVRRRVGIFECRTRSVVSPSFPPLPPSAPLVCVDSRELTLDEFTRIDSVESENFVRLFDSPGRVFLAGSPVDTSPCFPPRSLPKDASSSGYFSRSPARLLPEDTSSSGSFFLALREPSFEARSPPRKPEDTLFLNSFSFDSSESSGGRSPPRARSPSRASSSEELEWRGFSPSPPRPLLLLLLLPLSSSFFSSSGSPPSELDLQGRPRR